jgi:hypothetical protein
MDARSVQREELKASFRRQRRAKYAGGPFALWQALRFRSRPYAALRAVNIDLGKGNERLDVELLGMLAQETRRVPPTMPPA